MKFKDVLNEKSKKENLSVGDKHQIAIAKKTLLMDDRAAAARLLGGPNKEEARAILKKFNIKYKEQ